MTEPNGAIDALSLLVWATFLPLVIVLVMRSRRHHDEPPKGTPKETAQPASRDGGADPAP